MINLFFRYYFLHYFFDSFNQFFQSYIVSLIGSMYWMNLFCSLCVYINKQFVLIVKSEFSSVPKKSKQNFLICFKQITVLALRKRANKYYFVYHLFIFYDYFFIFFNFFQIEFGLRSSKFIRYVMKQSVFFFQYFWIKF